LWQTIVPSSGQYPVGERSHRSGPLGKFRAWCLVVMSYHLLQELADPLAGCRVPRPLLGWSSSWELPLRFSTASSSGACGTPRSCGSSVRRLPRVDSILFLALVLVRFFLEEVLVVVVDELGILFTFGVYFEPIRGGTAFFYDLEEAALCDVEYPEYAERVIAEALGLKGLADGVHCLGDVLRLRVFEGWLL
jgi:hypothetical protein